jgi:hypothetical protein
MALCNVRRVLPIVIGLMICGCAFEPQGDEPIDPPSQYRTWWARTEACSGRQGNFDRIKWYVVPGHGFKCPGGTCAGHWNSDHDIFIAGDWTNTEMVVRHEMLHDLLGQSGHPDPPFGKGCGLTWAAWSGGATD